MVSPHKRCYFLGPNIVQGLPYILFYEIKLPCIREVIQLTATFFCYRYAIKTALNGNHFMFGPILAVAFLFFGIFLMMKRALQYAAYLAASPTFTKILTPNTMYWSAGMLSGFLDNAPTYVNFLFFSIAKYGLSYRSVDHTHNFAYGLAQAPETFHLFEASAVGLVLFGAFNNIGNGPKFKVKAIAEEAGVKMPTFFRFIMAFSIPFLLPVLFLIWLLVIY